MPWGLLAEADARLGKRSEKKAINESPMEVRNALVSLVCIRVSNLSKDDFKNLL
jgi:hypothetical protein